MRRHRECSAKGLQTLRGIPPPAPPTLPTRRATVRRDWVTVALERDPTKRASIHDLVTHPWIVAHSRRSSSLTAPSASMLSSITSSDDGRSCHTPNAYGQGHVDIERTLVDACHGEDPKVRAAQPPIYIYIYSSAPSQSRTLSLGADVIAQLRFYAAAVWR